MITPMGNHDGTKIEKLRKFTVGGGGETNKFAFFRAPSLTAVRGPLLIFGGLEGERGKLLYAPIFYRRSRSKL